MRDEEMDAYRHKAIDAARGRLSVWSDGVPNPAPEPPPPLPEHSKRSRKGPIWMKTVIEWDEFKRRKQKSIMALLSEIARECERGAKR